MAIQDNYFSVGFSFQLSNSQDHISMQDRSGYNTPYFSSTNSKPPTPSPVLSKSSLIQWLRNTLSHNDVPNSIKIEDLGSGVIFCKLINHYYSNVIQQNRIINNPRNEYQSTLNLKLLQNAIVQLKINVPLDVGKVSRMKFLENWNLLNGLYRHFNHNDIELSVGGNDQCKSISGSLNFPTFGSTTSISGTASVSKGLKRPSDNSSGKEAMSYQKPIQKESKLMKSASITSLHQFSNGYINSSNHSNMQTGSQYQPAQNFGFSNLQRQYSKQQFGGYNGTPKASTGKIYKENQYQRQLQRTTPLSISSPFITALNSPKTSFQKNTPQFGHQSSNMNNSESMQSVQSSRHSSPVKGKWSVSSNFFCSNHHAIIDRVKQILLKSSNDTEKIRQVKMLMGISIDADLIKIQDDMDNYAPIIQKIEKTESKQSKIEHQKQKGIIKGKSQQKDEQKQNNGTNKQDFLKESVNQEVQKQFCVNQ